jgi:hypothetical protein
VWLERSQTGGAVKSIFERASAISKNPDRLQTSESRCQQNYSDDSENRLFFNETPPSKWMMEFARIFFGDSAP